MATLDTIFGESSSTATNPKLLLWTSLIESNPAIRCEIKRDRNGLGFEPAQIRLSNNTAGAELLLDETGWNESLNDYLLDRAVRAVNTSNEATRFNLMLRAKFRIVEIRYGEGYFNAILLQTVKSTFEGVPGIQKILQRIGGGNPSEGRAYANAKDKVDTILFELGQLLVSKLKYSRKEGEDILSSALISYLDERFSIYPGDLLRIATTAKLGEVETVSVVAPTSRIVIFDSNAYLRFVGDKALEGARSNAILLRQRELQKGNVSLAHPIVVWELVAGLTKPSSATYQQHLSALVALGEHTASRNRLDGGIDLIADSLSTISRELFGRLPAGYIQGLQNMGSLVTHITKKAPNISDPVARQNIDMLANGMVVREQSWIRGMERVFEEISPGVSKALTDRERTPEKTEQISKLLDSSEFFNAWALYIVASSAAAVGISSMSNNLLTGKIDLVKQRFPVPFRLMTLLLKQLLDTPTASFDDPEIKQWKFVWNSMICFSVGPGTISNAPVFLITSDRQITAAATTAGFAHQVSSLEDYLQSLAWPGAI